MKKLVCSAVALSLTTVAGQASESEWSQLDKEVEALTMSLSQDGDGPNIGGRIYTIYGNSSDRMVGMEDLGGFTVPDARIHLSGSVGSYSYMLQHNFGSGALGDGGSGLLDAYVKFPIGELQGTVGQYRPPILRSGLVSGDRLAFVDRSELGKVYSGRDTGIMLNGDFDAIGWWVAVMNGALGSVGDELLLAGRVDFDFLGEGTGDVEGSYGGNEDPSGTVGLSFFTDGETGSDGFAVEASLSTNVYSVAAELVSLGEGDDPTPGATYYPSANGIAASGFHVPVIAGDTTPFSISGTYMLQPDTWEVGLRFQDLDDAADSTKIDVAATHFVEGHNLKYQAQFTTYDSDSAAIDGTLILLGMNLTF